MRSNLNGFTLIELLIVIAIIGILSTIMIPNLLGARQRANDTAAASCAKQIASAQEVVFIDSQTYAASLVAVNAATGGMANNCEASWVDDSDTFDNGWDVEHPNGRGVVYTVRPGGIATPP